METLIIIIVLIVIGVYLFHNFCLKLSPQEQEALKICETSWHKKHILSQENPIAFIKKTYPNGPYKKSVQDAIDFVKREQQLKDQQAFLKKVRESKSQPNLDNDLTNIIILSKSSYQNSSSDNDSSPSDSSGSSNNDSDD